MNPNTDDKNRANRDPISKQPGSHPVGTGVGAAAGGAAGVAGAAAAGAAMGSAVGPVGTTVGAAAGAVAGGLIGKGVAEKINPTEEDAYWREHHTEQPYGSESTYDSYRDAYRVGYEGYGTYGSSGGRFEDYEDNFRTDWDSRGSSLKWEKARLAARAAWDRVDRHNEQLIGSSVEDREGKSVGKVSCVWVDEQNEPMFLGVKTGWLVGKNHVVPVHTAQRSNTSERIRLPFSEEQIKDAPSFDADAEIDEYDSREIFRHFGLSTGTQGQRQTARQQELMESGPERTEDEKTIELHREELKVGKRDVEAGGIRIRKIVRTEVVNQPVELQREELVVERVPAGSQTGSSRADFKEEDVFIPLRRQEVVVAKEARTTEKVRVGKKTELEHRDISETVRSEDVEVERTGARDS